MKSFFTSFSLALLLLAMPLVVFPQGADQEKAVVSAEEGAPETSATSADVIQDLVFQYEEDSMARALYTEFGKLYPNVMPFRNIPKRGETHHVNAIFAELERRKATDLVSGFQVGAFTNQEMQSTYERLLAQGKESLAGAIKSALEVEEGDIAGLRRLAAETDDPEADKLYAFLEMGSHRHLRAFARQAEVYNVTYEPKHLSAEDYATALNPANDGKTPAADCDALGSPEACGGCGQNKDANAKGTCNAAGHGGGQGPAGEQSAEKAQPEPQHQEGQKRKRRRLGKQ